MINAFYEPKQHWTKNTIVATLISPVKFIHSEKQLEYQTEPISFQYTENIALDTTKVQRLPDITVRPPIPPLPSLQGQSSGSSLEPCNKHHIYVRH